MKRCPNCNQVFSDDNVFCQQDGTTLLFVSQTSENPSLFPVTDSAPTQVVSRPRISSSSAASDSSKWLYLIIGAIAATILALGITFYFSQNANQKESGNFAKSNNTTETISSPASQNSAKTENKTILSPKGRWTGNLTYPWGAVYSAQADFTDEGSGQIRGQVVWICTAYPKKEYQIGTKEIEVVQGTFDTATRTLFLKENKSDPNDPPSKYTMTLAEDDSRLDGTIVGSGRPWNLGLRRF